MITTYLKFTDETQAIEALKDWRYTDDNGVEQWRTHCDRGDIDVIGTVYKETGETTTVDGFEIPVMEALEGFHVNLLCADTEEWEAFKVYPNTPSRIFSA